MPDCTFNTDISYREVNVVFFDAVEKGICGARTTYVPFSL